VTTHAPIGEPGLTWDEFCALPEPTNGRHPAALIDGEVVWVNPPPPSHQLILSNLQFAFETWMRAAPGRGLAIASPAIKVDERRGYEADFGWWRESTVRRGTEQPFDGAPALAVEVWSPSNWRQERLRKFSDYAHAGTAELWGIDPAVRRVDVARGLRDGVYVELLDLGSTDALTSPLLDDLTVLITDLLSGNSGRAPCHPTQNERMYLPEAFAETRVEVLAEIMRTAAVAQLVTLTADGLVATTLPMLFVPDAGANGALIGHVARANSQWRTSSDAVDALALFAGPDAYVSPSLYPAKREHGRVVPTWNYISVHVHGRLVVHDDPEWKLDLVRRLTEQHEIGRAQRWAVDDAPAEFIVRQLRAIVGLEVAITRIEGKRKLSQNRSAADVDAVAEALASGSTRDQAVAAEMRRRAD